MFQLTDKIVIERTVKVRVPQTGNGFRDVEFNALFQVIDPDEARQELGSIVDEAAGVALLLKRVFVGWPQGAICDEAGTQLAYSGEARDRLIAIPYVRIGLLKAYGRAISQAAEKN